MIKKHSKGFTLVEALVSVVILTAIMAIVSQFMMTTNKNQSYIRVQNYIKSEAERSLFRISKELNQNRLLIDNPSLGSGLDYVSRIDFSGIAAPIPGTTLPTIRTDGSLAEEKNCTDFPNNFFRPNAFGNGLMFVRFISKYEASGVADPNYARELDVYEFKFFYITDQGDNVQKVDRWNNPSTLNAQRLMEWTSVKYVDSAQLTDYVSNLTSNGFAASGAAIRADLISKGIEFAWDKEATALNNAFFRVNSSGAPLSSLGSHVIPRQSVRNALLLQSLSGEVYSVAYNSRQEKGNSLHFPTRMKVPYHYDYNVDACGGAIPPQSSNVDQALGAFPRGFEVGIVGSASGRSVIIRLSMVGVGNYNNTVEHAHTIIAYAKDR